MITIRVEGGLGNQMFQHAFARAFQRQGKRVALDLCGYRTNHNHNGFELTTVFRSISHDFITSKLIRRIRRIGSRRIREESSEFDRKFLEVKRGELVGYWQSPCYFESVTDQLRTDFEFPPLSGAKNIEVAEQINQGSSASIHVRRGDYVDHPLFGGICTIEYYRQAIETLREKVGDVQLFLFSNDVQWCLNHLPLPKATVPVSWNSGTSSFRDMQLISLCDHHIVANSSFSWWGAWLNAKPEKIVLAPDKWINGRDMKTLILPDWCVVATHPTDHNQRQIETAEYTRDVDAA